MCLMESEKPINSEKLNPTKYCQHFYDPILSILVFFRLYAPTVYSLHKYSIFIFTKVIYLVNCYVSPVRLHICITSSFTS